MKKMEVKMTTSEVDDYFLTCRKPHPVGVVSGKRTA